MTLATLKGRIQTKILTYGLVFLVTLPFWMMGGLAYVQLFVLSMLVGMLLEVLWGWVICHQPGWLTFVFGAIEFMSIAWVASYLEVPVSLLAAAAYYLMAWSVVQIFLIYVVPVFVYDWIDNGREIW